MLRSTARRQRSTTARHSFPVRAVAAAVLSGLMLGVFVLTASGPPGLSKADQVVVSATAPITPIVLGSGTITSQPAGMALDPNTLRLYVVSQGPSAGPSGRVSVIDVDPTHAAYNTVIASVDTGRVGGRGLSLSPDGTQVWLANFGGGGGITPGQQASIQVIDAATLTITGTLDFPTTVGDTTGCSTSGACTVWAFYDVTVDDTHAWITASGFSSPNSNNANMGVYRIDRSFSGSGTVTGGCAATTACTAITTSFSGTQPRGIDIVNGMVYASHWSAPAGTPAFSSIDPATLAVTPITIPTSITGTGARQILGFTSIGNTLYASDSAGTRLQVYDTETGTFSAPILGMGSTPFYPAAAPDNPETPASEARIYVPNYGGSTGTPTISTVTATGAPVSPVATLSLASLGTTSIQPYTMVVTPDGKYAYVTLWQTTVNGRVAVIRLDQVPVYTDPTTPADNTTFTTLAVHTPFPNTTFAATGTPGVHFSFSGANLPPGITINPTTGILSGTPTTPGVYTFTVRATDTDVTTVKAYVERAYHLTVTGQTDLTWKKTASDTGDPLAGATFTVTGPGGFSQTITDNGSGDDDPADGNFRLSDVPASSPSTFTITETTAPSGYLVNPTPLTVNVDDTSIYTVIDAGTVIDSPVPITDLAWQKTASDTGGPLAGATFTVTGPGGFSQTVTDNGAGDDDPADGSFRLLNVPTGLPTAAAPATFTITETTAPSGYLLNSTPLTVNVDDTNLGTLIDAGTVTDDPILAYIRKLGKDSTNVWVGMAGSAWIVLADTDGSATGTAPGVAITPVDDETGLFKITGLAAGSYWLAETQTPDGFSLLAAPISFIVGVDGSVTLGVGSEGGVADTDSQYPATGTPASPVIQVRDVPNVALPMTGGPGLNGFWWCGGIVLCLAFGVEFLRRKRNREAGRMTK